MEYNLNMVFLTAGGKKVTFSVSDPKSTLTQAQTIVLMDLIIAKNIFTTSSGDLISRSSAALVAKTVTEFDVSV